MPSSTSPREFREAHEGRRVLALWTGILAGPLVMLVLLQTNYTLSYVACETRQTWFLHLATAAAVVVVAAAGLWGWRAGRSPLSLSEPLTAPVSPETCDGRARWMALAAIASSAWFIVVILAMSVPVIVLETCQ
jgi:uncharacterized membrane protein